MDLSEFMNIILGGGLVGTVATIGSLRATVRKAKAEAMKAEAGAEAMRIDNAEHATRILMENIVKPLNLRTASVNFLKVPCTVARADRRI